MLRKGDQGADRPDAAPGGVTEANNTETNREALLSGDEKAQKFFDEIQQLKQDLGALKKKDVLGDVIVEPPADTAGAKTGGAADAPKAGLASEGAAPEAAGLAEAAPESGAPVSSASQLAGDVEASAEPAAASMTAGEAEPASTQASAEPISELPAEEAAARIFDAAYTGAAAATGDAEDLTRKAAQALEDAPQQDTAAEVFEAQFRQQMESQMQAVQEEENVRAKQKAARAARKEAYRQEKAARNAERREERRARAKRKQMERELKAEVKRKKRLADKSAELGGGIVNAHDTTVSTEIHPVAQFSLRDLLGILPRREKKAAATEEELQALKEEQEKKTADARQAATQLQRVRRSRFRSSALGQWAEGFKQACERHKNLLLGGLSMVLLVSVGAAGVINYCTAYEYSYNEHVLGYVKSKDQVLQITDMVQRALTEDKDMQVIIDARDDITFRRVSTLDRDVTPDSSDEVLRRLTYMGDLNVKAYGIYVNGDKAGSVRSKEQAAEVLKLIEARYASDKKGSEIEKAEILETVDVHKSNTSLREVYSPDRMAEILCTSGHKETVHTVIAGETLDDIALMYGTTEEKLVADNEGVDPKQLEVGSTLLIKQNAPLLTVRMTEKRSYTETIEYETEEQKTDEMYEDEQEILQEGEDGEEAITERTVSINGEVETTDVLKDEVTKEPVKKIVLVGTAERPPTVGDGVYIWPLAGGYTLTSHYGYRWGRLHAGIDLGTPVGNDVLAADGGTVVRAGYFGGYGYCVDIDHQNGQMTRYGHLSQILVSVGDEVYEGQHIAESGNTGASTGPHLHFEIHVNGQSHDPLQDLP